MRAHLLHSFKIIWILDLHGAAQRGPAGARFRVDQNVLDIEQPVAIALLCRKLNEVFARFEYLFQSEKATWDQPKFARVSRAISSSCGTVW